MKTHEEIMLALKQCASDERERMGDTFRVRLLCDASALIGELSNAASNWIDANSRPPEAWKAEDGNLVNYLVYMPEYGVDVGNYLQPAKTWVCMGIPCEVTHWKPLPEPPKEDSHEKP